MRDAILAIDQGTTSSRVVLFGLDGEVLQFFQHEFASSYPQSGWVEQDANSIWEDVFRLCSEAVAYASLNDLRIDSMGITNQRETVVFFDKTTQLALSPAIVWQDRRTTEACRKLIDAGRSEFVKQRTGLVIDPYFSASKIEWGLKHDSKVQEALANQNLGVATIDSWLLYKLTYGKLHATDSSNASRTMLFDIVEHRWCEELLALFDVPQEILPRVMNSIDDYGSTADGLFDITIPICALIGDQQSAAIGQNCLTKGDGKCTLGTGAFAMQNIGNEFCINGNGLLTTILFSYKGTITYATEGSVFSSGSTMQWLRDSLGIINHPRDSEKISASIDGTGGVYLVPAFNGLAAPHWSPDARAMMVGISNKTTRKEIVRAALEAVSYQCHDIFSGDLPESLKVDGGMSANDWLLQHLADILQCRVVRAANLEASAWGAARCAAIGHGLLDLASDVTISGDSFTPMMKKDERQQLLAGWYAAVDSCIKLNA
ncbi:MAG: glycerol kinase GlpK [Planctomycetota bacterium]|nr:glycerol kinase GlpK [Planctomycetota bacterium]